MSEAVLGLDAGTTSVKALVVDRAGEQLAEAASDPITTHAPEPGAAEQDADAVWQALAQAGRMAVAASGPQHHVAAVAMAAQSGSVFPIASTGEAERIITWMDARSRDLVASWSGEVTGRIRSISGWTAAPGLGLSTLAWRRGTGPPPPERIASVDDYLAHRLTDRWVTNPSNAAGLQLLDVERLDWSAELCSIPGVERDQLSTIRPSGEVLGEVTEEAAVASGLAPGTLLVVGGHDQACAALALGIVEPGRMMLSTGTAWVLTAAADHAEVDRLPPSLNLGPHVVGGRWSASQSLGAIGAVLEWWRGESRADHDELEADLADGALGPDDPLFVPALTDADRTSWGQFTTPTAGTPRATLTRAVVEAAAFELRRALDPLAPPTMLTVVGGAAANPRLVQILADVSGVGVRVPTGTSWPARGAAMLAARGVGWPEAASSTTAHVVQPHAAAHARHRERYEVYRRLRGG